MWQQNSSCAERSFMTCSYSFKFPLNSQSLISPAICSSYFWPQKDLFLFFSLPLLHNHENLTLASSNETAFSLEDNRLFCSAFLWRQGVQRKSKFYGKKIERKPHILTERFLDMSHVRACFCGKKWKQIICRCKAIWWNYILEQSWCTMKNSK